MTSEEFFTINPVFSLKSAATGLGSPDEPTSRTIERLKHHLGRGRIKRVAREIYAAVPYGIDPDRFQPDRYLVATVVRPDGVISHHAALELLGAAHSDWNECTILTRRRRAPIALDGVTVRFLGLPGVLVTRGASELGVRQVDRLGHRLRVTGPERTLVDGFWQPELAGGLAELVESASGFGVLDLELVRRVLEAYDHKTTWAAVGWFLERYRRTFFVPDTFLAELEAHRPRSKHYLPRSERGGKLVARWNLVLPEVLVAEGEPDER